MNSAKKRLVEYLIQAGSVYVHLLTRADGVYVPEHLKATPTTALQIGYNFPVPIPDLKIDDTGITATLSFSRTPYLCFVPWDAVFAITNEAGQGAQWPIDGELLLEPEDKPEERRPKLRLVK